MVVSAEAIARADAQREALQRTREEIDAAYTRGFNDGRDSISALPVLLVGAVSGALAMLAFVTLF